MGRRAGMRHLGYARLAENLKPEHPKLAKRLLNTLMQEMGVTGGLNVSFGFESAVAPGRYKPSKWSGAGDGAGRGSTPWGAASIAAMGELDAASMRYIEAKNARRAQGPEHAPLGIEPLTSHLSPLTFGRFPAWPRSAGVAKLPRRGPLVGGFLTA